MTVRDAYKLLGLSPEADLQKIKKRYRQLMTQVHPDVNLVPEDHCTCHAQEINHAYSVLKKALAGSSGKDDRHQRKSHTSGQKTAKAKKHSTWNASINENAYMEREILHYAEGQDGSVLGSFRIARGKYLWTMEEDFPLFLLSMYRCGKKLLDDIDASLGRSEVPAARNRIQAELTYLLTQQFIDGTALLKELAKNKTPEQDEGQVFYISSMLEPSSRGVKLKTGEALYPSGLKHHKLYLNDSAGQELGYLSFHDDRLYYVVIPLFEQRKVQVKIQVAERRPGKYENLDVWIRLRQRETTFMPENLNLKIEELLEQYR